MTPPKHSTQFYAFIIIFVISAFTFSTAGFVMGVAASDPHSNLSVAKYLYHNRAEVMANVGDALSLRDATMASVSMMQQMAAWVSPSTTPTPTPRTPEEQAQFAILHCSPYVPGTFTSLVDYLQAMNRPTSFTNRASFAGEYGVADYQGTSADNIRLLNAMLARDAVLAGCQTPAPMASMSNLSESR